ncbi:MAG: nucleoside hydrolase [Bacteroidales bacterium]|nr:nucleoside hydrolase [Bacteroidales bacterium]
MTLSLFVEAHSGKARFHVVIDTDGAADDLRAICMLLSNREVEVLAVTTSEGALTPDTGAAKVAALLRHFHHEGIPVGEGRLLGITPPMWRGQSENIAWGQAAGSGQPAIDREQAAKELILQAINTEEEKVTFICMGTLTNLNDALTAQPQLKERIAQVIWYNSSAKPLKGANYEADRSAAEAVLKSGLTVRIVSGNEKMPVTIDTDYLRMITGISGIYARQIADTHSNGVLQPVVSAAHMKAWDDLTVVYLFAPELFSTTAVSATVTAHQLTDAKALEQAKQTIVAVLTGKPDSENRVFYHFPEDTKFYAADVATVAPDVIANFGHSEWRAGVLANELHGHLGIYAIVGVKMGIRAREYFNIGVDDIVVVSYAGLHPPVSCMNDGLQVSTGATIGHGLISVAAGQDIRPEAMFTFKDKTIRMRLKQEYAQQIRRDVMEGIQLHGDLTEAYWLYIRALALRYWQEFDRHEIFEWVE